MDKVIFEQMFIDHKQLRKVEKHLKNHETLFTIIFQKSDKHKRNVHRKKPILITA